MIVGALKICQILLLCGPSWHKKLSFNFRLLDKLMVTCPNSDSCDELLQRGLLSDHLRYRCSGTLVACQFAGAGCDFRGPSKKMATHQSECGFKKEGRTNITKVTRLAIPGFWPNAPAPWKTGFSHQVRSWGCSKWSSFSWKFLSMLAFMMSLDRKNLSMRIGPKPGNSQTLF